MSAEVLVKAVPTLLTAPALPLGEWTSMDKNKMKIRMSGTEQLTSPATHRPIYTTQDEDVFFEKGDLNLWAKPLLWARMFHGHLSAFIKVTHSPGVGAAELDRLSVIAKSNNLAAQRSMKALSALPQASAPIEYAKISLLKERTSLAQNLLDTLTSS
ncbi:hypothetical protein cypCar_00029061 [Cyprinus carpio]|nr:hypothetical protein cypCar_00029061 [Cyprinus carpio]